MELTDEQLIANIISGDHSDYSVLFERYQHNIYNFAYSIMGNTEDAKDISQDAFIKVYEALPKIKEKTKFSSYLYRTTRNLAFDELKKKKRFATSDALEWEKDSKIDADPQRTLLLGEQQTEVQSVASKLNDDFRTVLALRELQELSYDEISSIMEIPRNSVGVLLLRARLKFKQEFRMSQVDVDKLTKECKDMLPLLAAFVDNELSEEDRVKVEKHLDDCPLCRLALEEMTEASKSYRGIIPLIPPPSLKENVISQINQQFSAQAPKPKDIQQSQSSLNVTQKMTPVQETATKGFKQKLAELALGEKILATSAVIILVGAVLTAGAYSLWSSSNSSGSDNYLSPYSSDFPAEMMEIAAETTETVNILREDTEAEEQEELSESEDSETDTSHGTTPSSDDEEDQTDLIRKAIIAKMDSLGLEPSDFTVTNIWYEGNQATGEAIPKDPQKQEGAKFELIKRDGEWVVVNYGTGLD